MPTRSISTPSTTPDGSAQRTAHHGDTTWARCTRARPMVSASAISGSAGRSPRVDRRSPPPASGRPIRAMAPTATPRTRRRAGARRRSHGDGARLRDRKENRCLASSVRDRVLATSVLVHALRRRRAFAGGFDRSRCWAGRSPTRSPTPTRSTSTASTARQRAGWAPADPAGRDPTTKRPAANRAGPTAMWSAGRYGKVTENPPPPSQRRRVLIGKVASRIQPCCVPAVSSARSP